MKKKMVVNSLGILGCISLIGGVAFVYGNSVEQTSVTEERKLTPRFAEEILYAEALTEEISLTENIDDVEGEEKTTEYLSYYFGISLESDSFLEALNKICPMSEEGENGDEDEKDDKEADEKETEEAADKELTGADMIKTAVVCVQKEQMAQSYSEEKVKRRLEFYGIYNTINKKLQAEELEAYRYIVCALDLGMMDEGIAQNALGGELTREEQAELLMGVANICGRGRKYLGYSNEQKIYADMNYLCKLYQPFSDAELEQVAALLLEEELVTECTLRRAEYDARFLPSHALRYSYSVAGDYTAGYVSEKNASEENASAEVSFMEHVEQFVGVLNSENMVAKVHMEPKMVLHKEALEELQNKDNSEETKKETSLACLSYDLVLEFESEEDRNRFSEMVEKYHKSTLEVQAEDEKKEGIYTYAAADGQKLKSGKENVEIAQLIIEGETANLEVYCLDTQLEEVKRKIMELLSEQEIAFYERTEETVTPETEAEMEVASETESTSETEAVSETESTSETEAVSETESTSETKAASETESTSETEGLSETESESGTEAETEKEGLKIYSKSCICNKEFFFLLGGEEKLPEEEEK